MMGVCEFCDRDADNVIVGHTLCDKCNEKFLEIYREKHWECSVYEQ